MLRTFKLSTKRTRSGSDEAVCFLNMSIGRVESGGGEEVPGSIVVEEDLANISETT